LLLTARQLARITAGQVGEFGRGENSRYLSGDFLAWQFPQREPIGHVAGDRHVRPQRVALKDHRHFTRFRRQGARRRRYHAAPDHDFPRRRLHKPGNQAQGRGLAATGRSEQAHQQAMLDVQRHVVDHRQSVVSLGQIPQLNRRHALSPDPKLPRTRGTECFKYR
jgi:hypothetical protein